MYIYAPIGKIISVQILLLDINAMVNDAKSFDKIGRILLWYSFCFSLTLHLRKPKLTFYLACSVISNPNVVNYSDLKHLINDFNNARPRMDLITPRF
jgi:hypothetical protein